jgi:hypothetical protein
VNSRIMKAENLKEITIRKPSRRHDFVEILVFVIPCLQFIQINLIGVLNGSDIILLATAVYLVARGKVEIAASAGKTLMVLCSLWLISQCVTDVVRHSAFADYARGWSNIGMTLVNLAVLWTLLYGRSRRIACYGWGLVIGSLLTYMIVPDEGMTDYPWKFGLAFPVTLAVFLLVSRTKWRGRWPIIAIVTIGLVNVYLGSRSRGGFCLAAGIYVATIHRLSRKGIQGVRLPKKTILAICASLAIGAAGVFWLYHYAASGGLLGEKARTEYLMESSGQYGLLLGGRVEMLASIPAIYDSPILGHGSWAKDPTYVIAERQALALLGYEDEATISRADIEEGLIPSHSYLFGAWVDAGILGALFWAWAISLILRALIRVYPRSVLLLPLMSYAAFSMLWDIPFSPYGATARIIFPYFIIIVATCMGMVQNKPVAVAT